MLGDDLCTLEDAQEALDSCENDESLSSDVSGGAPYGKKFGPRVSPMAKAFCREYVINGGNIARASKASGYASGSGGSKALLNGSIQAEIKRLSLLNLEAALPKLIQRGINIALDDATPANVALDAIFKLMDRAGLKPKSGPLVQINSTTNTQNVLASDAAQQLIADVWKHRTNRLSDISASMSDTTQAIEIDERLTASDAETAPDEAAGGGLPEGPSPAPAIVPTHSSKNYAKIEKPDR